VSEPDETHPLVITARAPDRTGLVADIAGAIAGAGGNILDVGQHSDVEADWFGCRLEVDPAVDRATLSAQLDALVERRGLSFELHDAQERARVVIVCSKTLHCASDLVARVSIGALPCTVDAIVSDYTSAEPLAERHAIRFDHVPLGDDRAAQEAHLGRVLKALDPDLIVLARYMRILPGWLCEAFEGRMINIHHSFLPAFAGAGPYKRAHERGVKLIGATAHYVTAELDAGPIIAQDVERVSHRDSIDDLVRRGADVERSVLAAAVRLHLEHRVMVFDNRTCVFD
jgi:formyltetrahydrofolate deformylase